MTTLADYGISPSILDYLRSRYTEGHMKEKIDGTLLRLLHLRADMLATFVDTIDEAAETCWDNPEKAYILREQVKVYNAYLSKCREDIRMIAKAIKIHAEGYERVVISQRPVNEVGKQDKMDDHVQAWYKFAEHWFNLEMEFDDIIIPETVDEQFLKGFRLLHYKIIDPRRNPRLKTNKNDFLTMVSG